MNSKQRRKAYRAMPQPSVRITWGMPGKRRTGIVIGIIPAGPEQLDIGLAKVPNVNRTRHEHFPVNGNGWRILHSF